MFSQIRPEEVTRLAAYVEAGDQLSKSEFFGEDDRSVISEHFAQFGPASRLEALLAPFRRMWMNDENANFNRVAKIIEYHSVSRKRQGIAQQQRELFNHNKGTGQDKSGLSPADVIDLWLYTQYAHCQTNRSHGRFVREDFERQAKKLGKTQLEFEFRNAVRLLGTHFLILYYEAAVPELDEWVTQRGIKLPFETKNAFGSDRTEANDDGVIVQRGPHRLLEKEQLPQKLIRLLERHNFQLLKSLFGNILDLSYASESIELYAKASEQIAAHNSVERLLAALAYTEGTSDQQSAHSQYGFLDPVTHQKCFIKVYPNKLIEFGPDAKCVVERLYSDLRIELLSEKSTSTFLDVQRRLDEEIAARHAPRK